MNAHDYYQQGRKAARMTGGRSPCNAYSMPVFGASTSWQARCFAGGFRSQLRDMKVTVSIAWELDGSSGSTECQPVQVERTIESLQRAGYTVNDVRVIA